MSELKVYKTLQTLGTKGYAKPSFHRTDFPGNTLGERAEN